MFVNFRKILAKKLFDKRTKSKNQLDISKIGSILILRDDNKIGDMVITTILFREIKKQYPNIKIHVLCGKTNQIIIKDNPYVDKIFICNDNFFQNIFVYKQIRKEKIDLVIDFLLFRPRPTQLLKLRIINSNFFLGLCKDGYNIYDLSLNVDYNSKHISKIYCEILKTLNIQNINTKYDIFLNNKYKDYAKSVMEQYKSTKKIFFNTHSASSYKTLSYNNVCKIIKLLKKENFKVILNSRYNIKDSDIIVLKKDDFRYILAVIEETDIVLTVDTSIVHVCNAFNKKMVSIYLNDKYKEEKLSSVWAPNYNNAIQLLSKTNDINSIDNLEIIKALKSLM